MRYIICITLLFYGSFTIKAHSNAKDSLIQLLNAATQSPKRAQICRNLADICFETPEEKIYLEKTYQEAQKAGYRNMMRDALGDLSSAYIKKDQLDSAKYYIEKIRKSGSKEETINWITYLNMRSFESRVSQGNTEKALKEELKLLEKQKETDNIYRKIERAYIIGNSLLAHKKTQKAIPYFKTATKLSSTLPSEEGYKYQNTNIWLLAQSHLINREFSETIKLIEELLSLQETHYNKYYKKERPFYNINTRYIQDYGFLLSCISHLPKNKADLYMQRLLLLSKGSTNPADKYSIFISLNNYYLHLKKYEQAQVTNDSLIKYAHIVAPYNIPNLHEVSSLIYNAMGKYKEAYTCLKLSYSMKDSLTTEKARKQLNELQIKYDVDKLNYENSLLDIKNKQIILLCISSILLITIAVCIYQYYTLKREEKMKNKLRILNIKAEESEKMKSAFINSMCHEIRTPLNAIVGFSDLIFDESIDIEAKQAFPKLIQVNTALLTALVNDMLEVSNLDSSSEMLPCEPVDLNEICTREMDKLKNQRKNNIEYILNLPADKPIICTHAKYLSLVIEQLLGNANKFTEQGFIKLQYHIEQSQNKLRLEVEDSGCGISSEKHELVFERFTKLDTFTQGNGLGLYLCDLIVKRLAGEINIDPNYKQGTRFVIDLPIQN